MDSNGRLHMPGFTGLSFDEVDALMKDAPKLRDVIISNGSMKSPTAPSELEERMYEEKQRMLEAEGANRHMRRKLEALARKG